MKSFFLSYKTVKWLALIALAALLVPMLCLGFYAAPAADDFSYGAPAHRAWVESGSVLAALAAAADKVVESYFGWQGTYSAIFLMAIQPAVFSEGLYWLTTFIMVFALLTGTFSFCRAFFGRLLGLEKDLADIIAVLLCLLSTQLLPSAVQGFYWFNGSVYYVFFHGLMLIAMAVGLRLVKCGGRGWAFLLCLLCFLLGGSNYVTALSSCIIWFFAAAFLYISKGSWKRLILPGLILLLGFGLSFIAPGNAVRQQTVQASCGVIEAVLLSFKNCVLYSAEWFSLPVLGSMAFICILALGPVRKTGFSFRFPGLVTAFSFCLVSAMFCPPIYATTEIGEWRLVNIIYFAWLLALAVNLVYWLGWLSKKKRLGVSFAELKALPLVLACALLFAGFVLPALSGRGYTSLLALGSLRSGEAKAWHDCALRRFEVLNDESIKDARIEPYPGQPYLLFYNDIVEDPEAWENVDMANFYGKDSVSFNTIS